MLCYLRNGFSGHKIGPGSKIRQINKTVINLSIICCLRYRKRVIELKSVYKKGKNCLCCKTLDFQ